MAFMRFIRAIDIEISQSNYLNVAVIYFLPYQLIKEIFRESIKVYGVLIFSDLFKFFGISINRCRRGINESNRILFC